MKILFLFVTICIINNTQASVNFEGYIDVKNALYKAFEELRPNKNHKLIINAKVGDNPYYWFGLNMVHASYSGFENQGNYTHNIFLFGGFIRLQEMTKDGLLLAGCHEIGHGIGGAPLKVTGSSSEAQSDYFATKNCLQVAFKFLKPEPNATIQDNYVINFCKLNAKDRKFCLRAFGALRSDIYFFETLGESSAVDNYSASRAVEFNDGATFYPDAQCRVDTMIHGIVDIERPNCWYPGGIERKL
jgi:hypothetical protein